MEISRVSLRMVNMNRVKAIASITFEDSFCVHELRVVEGDKGLFVAMPSRKLPNGEFRDVAHPINVDMRKKIDDAIKAEYDNVKQSIAAQNETVRDEEDEKKSEEIPSEELEVAADTSEATPDDSINDSVL